MISALFCVASAIYFEARGEPLEGQAAVAWVIYHRKRALEILHDLSGMAIVPVEPTDEMVDYAERMDWSIPDSRAVVINIWQAMLAAAKEKGE